MGNKLEDVKKVFEETEVLIDKANEHILTIKDYNSITLSQIRSWRASFWK